LAKVRGRVAWGLILLFLSLAIGAAFAGKYKLGREIVPPKLTLPLPLWFGF